MFALTCRQRGCALEPAESVPELCPVCGNPLHPDDQVDASPPGGFGHGADNSDDDTQPSESDPA